MRVLLLLLATILFVGIPSSHAVSCISCTSSNDPRCASANYTASSPKECYGPNPCAVSILANTGHTFRGCSSDPQCYDNFEQCETCDGDGCNSVAYPSDRRSCLNCSSATDADCTDLDPEAAVQQYRAVCVVHLQEASACVTLFSHYVPVRRACLGDLEPSLRESCERDLPDCVQCGGEYCNVVTVRPDERCLQCDSEDRGCNGGESEVSGCRKVSEGKCYARLLGNGTVRRGCFYELTTEEAAGCNSDNCVVCSGTGCNKGTFVMNRNGSPLSVKVAGYLVAIAFATLIVL